EIVKNQTMTINAGDQVRLGSEFGPELKLTSVHGQTLQDGMVVFQRPGEDVWHRSDGYVEVSDRVGLARVEDGSGRVLAAKDTAGGERHYSYRENGELNKIEYAIGRVLERKEGTNTWQISQPGFSNSEWKGSIEVQCDGSLQYKDEKLTWREKL